MTYRLLACAALIVLVATSTSDYAKGTDCVPAATSEITLALVSLERIEGDGGIDAERTRLGETARFEGVHGRPVDTDGGSRESVMASWTSENDSIEFGTKR